MYSLSGGTQYSSHSWPASVCWVFTVYTYMHKYSQMLIVCMCDLLFWTVCLHCTFNCPNSCSSLVILFCTVWTRSERTFFLANCVCVLDTFSRCATLYYERKGFPLPSERGGWRVGGERFHYIVMCKSSHLACKKNQIYLHRNHSRLAFSEQRTNHG